MTSVASKATYSTIQHAQCLALDGQTLACIVLALCLVGIVLPLVAYRKGFIRGEAAGIKRAERTEAAAVADTLERFNRWRRDGDDVIAQPSPLAIGEALDKAVALLRAPIPEGCTPSASRPSDDAMWERTLRERDDYHEWADKLADKIAHITGIDIGEHSSANCPWRQALDAELPEGCTPADARHLREDAERYRWLRAQNWNDSALCVVVNPKSAVRLGHYCPSGERLDAAIDAARTAQQGDER